MKEDRKIAIDFLGLNTIMCPRSLAPGFHPRFQNWFDYEVNSMSRRKGTKYLDIGTLNGKKTWVLSENNPCSVPVTVPIPGVTNPEKYIPMSNIGIKAILDTHYYNPLGENMFLMAVDTYDCQITQAIKDAFTVAVSATAGTFDADYKYFSLYIKTASGLRFVKTINLTPNASKGLDIHYQLPQYAQYAILAQGKLATYAYDGDGVEPIAVLYPGSTSFTVTSATKVKAYTRLNQLINTATLMFLDVNNILPWPTINTHIYETKEYADQGGQTAIYFWNPQNLIPTQAFRTSLDYTSPVAPVQYAVELGSRMPGGSDYYLSSNDPITGFIPRIYPGTFVKAETNSYELNVCQNNYGFIESNGAVYLPTIAGRVCKDVIGSDSQGYGWPHEKDSTMDFLGGYWPRISYYNSPSKTGPILEATGLDEIESTGSTQQTTGTRSDFATNWSGPPRAQLAAIYMDKIVCAGNPWVVNALFHTNDMAGQIVGRGDAAFRKDNNPTEITFENDTSNLSMSAISGLGIFSRTTVTSTLQTLLTIFKQNSHGIIMGDWADGSTPPLTSDFAVKQLSKKTGLISSRGHSLTSHGLFFLAHNGVFQFNPDGEPVPSMSIVNNLFRPRKISLYQDGTGTTQRSEFNTNSYLTVFNNILRVCYNAQSLIDPSNPLNVRSEIWADLRYVDVEKGISLWGPHQIVFPGSFDTMQVGDGYFPYVGSNNVPAVTPCICRPKEFDLSFTNDILSGSEDSDGSEISSKSLIGANQNALICFDVENYFKDLGQRIDSEFISSEMTAKQPSLLKSFRAIGMAIESDYSGKFYISVDTDTGFDAIAPFEFDKYEPGVFDVSNWDEVGFEGQSYPFERILFEDRPVGRSARLKILASGDTDVIISDVELFYQLKKRSYI